MLEWLAKTEPLWLLCILTLETYLSYRIWSMAKVEFEYDKEWNERKAARRKKQMNFDQLTQGEGK